ncbi:signal transduction histidine kinase [Wenyingzhuangia heitensis]|uniref:Signal transduction histidine kinase n=1 Tax=Wenyingzhuangia heitensis TaxID=1487859 RepID=A0ABX0UB79_9FLAO|nr:ATP-binding protein [Wenyingzhuangia heitensis]NIJ45609.1 signal transduction histidine kinase [Wenyingzhuangia heitensis]
MGDELEFKISTGLKDIIGKDLITDEFIAVFELVKNSYDAFAKNVIIIIEDDKLIISDDGKGMSLDDLKNKWLFVAYSAKKDNSEDINSLDKNESYRDIIQERKHYAGAKGIGRFSSDRLGKLLTIKTKNNYSTNLEELKIDWSRFEKNQKNTFETVKVNHSTITNNGVKFPENSNSGTILEISNLYNVWDRTRILALKHSLEKLINPFSDNNDFNIEIICNRELDNDKNGFYKSGRDKKGKKYFDRDKVNGLIKNAILDILELKTSQITFKISKGEIETKIIDRGELIYHIKEPAKDFQIIENLQIDLYFLNRSAKHNFSLKMGIQPIHFGSIFLFKNGFRIQPFGEKGDDSWGIDFRAQQGYNRFLGTRNLFGRVSISTDNLEQFKEVSNREGGLIETPGYHELINAFDLAHRRLERYVVGVLWGEGFRKQKYFGDDSDKAAQYRLELSTDKDSDNLEIVKSNLGSKLDFIQIIKSLSSNKDIKIIDFNKDFIDLVNEKIDDTQLKFISDLKDIADKTDDYKLLNKVNDIENSFERLKKEKENAQKKAIEEERKRKEAEAKVIKEEKARKEAENKAKKEEEKRIKAELDTLKKEKERALADLAKLKAEQKAREEKEKNKDLSDKLIIETKKTQYLTATRKTLSDDAEQLVHSIDLYVGNASTYVNDLLISNIDEQTKSKIYSIKNNIDKAIKVSQIIIKSNFDYKYTSQRINLPGYIKEYLEGIDLSRGNVRIETKNVFEKFALINPIEIDIVFDNLVSNSIKAKAENIIVEFIKSKTKLEIYYYDDGIGVSEILLKNPDSIFELGVRDSKEKGSGIGMYDAKKRITNLKGSINFIGNNIKLSGASFKIVL